MVQNASSPVPGEFFYWQRITTPWASALRRAIADLFGFDPAPSDEVVRTIASMYFDADPVAERFVDDVYLERGPHEGRALLDRALDQGLDAVDDAPKSLISFFEDIDTDPEWLDRDLVEQGARAFRRWGTSVFHFAGAITLSAYSECSVAKPLALSGQYQGASARRRFIETAAFWIAVSEPGGLERLAAGWKSAVRVRIMHVFVRQRLLSHPEWRLREWGMPISQADALLTLMGGSVAPALALRAMGFRTNAEEIAALMHFWRYVGHLMGVRPKWWPKTTKEALQLGFVTALKSAHRAGDDGVKLCQSFTQAFEPDRSQPLHLRWRDELDHRLHQGYVRFFLPPWIYKRNRLPGAGLWALHPLAQWPMHFAIDTARRRFKPLDDLIDRRARAQRKRWFARHSGGHPASYVPSPHLTR